MTRLDWLLFAALVIFIAVAVEEAIRCGGR